MADLTAACLNDARLKPYISRDGTVRAFMASPAALLFTVDADADGVALVRGILDEMLSAWIALAKMSPGVRVDAATLRARDRVTRQFIRRDPDSANMRPLLGRDTTETLFRLCSGFDEV